MNRSSLRLKPIPVQQFRIYNIKSVIDKNQLLIGIGYVSKNISIPKRPHSLRFLFKTLSLHAFVRNCKQCMFVLPRKLSNLIVGYISEFNYAKSIIDDVFNVGNKSEI